MGIVKDIKELNSLGNKETRYDFEYNQSLLEAFEKKLSIDQVVRLNALEFTTLCPITGQPDFATIEINYVPDKYLVESKSLKLYLFSFRSMGNFHEAVIDRILGDLVNLLDPKYIEVIGRFNSRGGISINPFANYAKKGSEYETWVSARKINVLSSKI